MKWHVSQQPWSNLMVHLLGTGNFADMCLADHTYPKTQAASQVLRPQLTECAVVDFIVEACHMIYKLDPRIIRSLI